MEEKIDAKRVLKYILRRKCLFIYIVIIFVVIANIFFFAFIRSIYSNVGKIRISNAATGERLITYKDLLLTDTVIDNAIRNSNVIVDKSYIKDNLFINANIGSEIYTITLKSSDKELGKKLCESIILEFIKTLEIDKETKVYIHDTVTTTGPINYDLIKNEILYIVVGCLLSFGCGVIMYYFNDTIKSEEELEKYDIFGIIDNSKRNLNMIKNKIRVCNHGNIMFLSSMKNDNCKNEILDLVKEFAKELNVIFIDTNIRNGKSKRLGYSNLLNNYKENISKYVMKYNGFDIIQIGTGCKNPEVLLLSKNNEKIINSLKKKYDYVVLYNDSGTDYSDSLILSKLSDYNFIITKINKTNKKELEKAVNMYKQVDINVTGIIIVDKE